jgi:hypothetical protein
MNTLVFSAIRNASCWVVACKRRNLHASHDGLTIFVVLRFFGIQRGEKNVSNKKTKEHRMLPSDAPGLYPPPSTLPKRSDYWSTV